MRFNTDSFFRFLPPAVSIQLVQKKRRQSYLPKNESEEELGERGGGDLRNKEEVGGGGKTDRK